MEPHRVLVASMCKNAHLVVRHLIHSITTASIGALQKHAYRGKQA